MDENKENNELKEYADGWITERKGTDAPVFLKAAFVIIPLGALTYFFVYMNGETFHSDRGPLVQAFNKATGTANGFMYFVGALIVIYAIILVAFAFKKFKD
ncbi:MAG: hypothetical protein IPN69_15030 [Acidobacteria bacterium]|nr:hypothetical protein [Acidobacteriota bacterium]MBK8812025.1 hypothetical protein [Acidobacteriota bacterium]